MLRMSLRRHSLRPSSIVASEWDTDTGSVQPEARVETKGRGIDNPTQDTSARHRLWRKNGARKEGISGTGPGKLYKALSYHGQLFFNVPHKLGKLVVF